jgi:hypothetical protein
VLSLTGPLALGQPHHIGVVVPDLEAALAEMAGVGGGWLRLQVREPPDPADIDPSLQVTPDTTVRVRAAYSRLGPTHIEIIEAQPGTMWDPRTGPHLHHMGYWLPVHLLAERSRELEAEGFVLRGTRVNGTGDSYVAMFHEGPAGLLVELLVWGNPVELARRTP